MHPRRIPTFIGLCLVLLGLVLLFKPYTTHITINMGGETSEYSLACQAPLVDRVTSDPPQVWKIRGTDEIAVGTGPSYPSPCHDERDVRGMAGAILIGAGVTVWVVARRREVRRSFPVPSPPAPISSGLG